MGFSRAALDQGTAMGACTTRGLVSAADPRAIPALDSEAALATGIPAAAITPGSDIHLAVSVAALAGDIPAAATTPASGAAPLAAVEQQENGRPLHAFRHSKKPISC